MAHYTRPTREQRYQIKRGLDKGCTRRAIESDFYRE